MNQTFIFETQKMKTTTANDYHIIFTDDSNSTVENTVPVSSIEQ